MALVIQILTSFVLIKANTSFVDLDVRALVGEDTNKRGMLCSCQLLK